MKRDHKLKEIAKEALKPEEQIENVVIGKMLDKSSFGTEIVDGLFAATNHRMIIVKKPIIGKKTDSFTYGQIGSISVTEAKDSVSLCTAGEVLTLKKIDKDKEEETQEFVDNFKDRKKPKKATVEVNVQMKKEKKPKDC